MNTRRTFFNAFNQSFPDYSSVTGPGRGDISATKRVPVDKKVGKSKKKAVMAAVKVSAVFGLPSTFTVETTYLDAEGAEISHGRVKKPDTLAEAVGDARDRVLKLRK